MQQRVEFHRQPGGMQGLPRLVQQHMQVARHAAGLCYDVLPAKPCRMPSGQMALMCV